ncbi:hypothetical protein HYN48_04395 [Flavobacterium magnum]|uniref:Peptidase M12B domain-containing protein n=1 Tax=Flavobacterium magnum TaxID=2162713 RepID=A0A2S0RCM6_9FLAO|nr:M12 family metallo-peptidase [Flavobacterium magnum]AWA29384.1 hypothetical protein HYN48_04395 [Flavobacterium magnum]
MKKILLLTALLFSVTFQAQKAVVKDVEKLIAKKAVFKTFEVFTPANAVDKNRDAIVTDAAYAKANVDVINAIVAQKYPTIEIEIPYHQKQITVQLYSVNLFADGFHIDTDRESSIPFTPGVYYRGMIKGDENSIASLSFYDGQMMGIVSNPEISNLVIGKLIKAGNVNDYIIYEDQNMQVSQNFDCHTDDKNISSGVDAHRDGNDTASPQTVKCVSMYFEMDYNLYQSNGSNAFANANWMMGLFNNVQTLYANETVNIAFKALYMWTTPDPYTGSDSSDYKDQFGSLRPNFDGDVGSLIGIDPGGLGGVAASIGGICSDLNYSYSDVDPGYQDVPTYSWTVNVVTHENGHVLGSRHTHACVWNGNNTSIDSCAGYVEGGCAMGPIPASNVKGTMMSYCHLVSGVGIAFSNGFGPQPSAAVVNFVNASSCLSSGCTGACVNRVSNINVSSLSSTSVQVTWADTSGTDEWEISVSEASSSFEFSDTVTAMTYTANSLNVGTQYKVKIRPICSGFVTTSFIEFFFTMSANLNVEDNNNIDFAFYPNPTKDIVNISAKSNIDEVLVYNIEGRLLLRKSVKSADTTIDISGFATGTYFFKLRSEDKEAHFKILKM